MAKVQGEEKGGSDSFIWLLVGVSSCILIVLIYVGWKKYRGQVKRDTKDISQKSVMDNEGCRK